MVDEEITIQHKDNIVIMEIEEWNRANDDVNKEELIEYDKQGMIDVYTTEEEE